MFLAITNPSNMSNTSQHNNHCFDYQLVGYQSPLLPMGYYEISISQFLLLVTVCFIAVLFSNIALACNWPPTTIVKRTDKFNSYQLKATQQVTDVLVSWSFPNDLWPLFQNESWCSSFHMKISFHLHVNKD